MESCISKQLYTFQSNYFMSPTPPTKKKKKKKNIQQKHPQKKQQQQHMSCPISMLESTKATLGPRSIAWRISTNPRHPRRRKRWWQGELRANPLLVGVEGGRAKIWRVFVIVLERRKEMGGCRLLFSIVFV